MMAMSENGDEDRPMRAKDAVLSFLLRLLALLSFSTAAFVALPLLLDETGWGPEKWAVTILLAVLLLSGGSVVWGLRLLKLRADTSEPISPRTRKTNTLFALSGLVAVPGTLALAFGTFSEQDPFPLFSNSPVAPVIAVAAIAGWLLSMLIGWWWHFSADEHERQANAFGAIFGAGLFVTVTPAWWVAARGGLVTAPDPMILWLAVMVVWMTGWFWRRYR